MKIELIRLSPSAKIPKRAKEDDAGLDLFASENITILAKNRKTVPTGIAIHLPKKTVGLIWDKSGIARENGLTTLGGVIDSGYQGEIQVIIYNSGSKPVTIKKHQKVAQLIIQYFLPIEFKNVKKFSKKSKRGRHGFCSTGK